MNKLAITFSLVFLFLPSCHSRLAESTSESKALPENDYNVEFLRNDFKNSKAITLANAKTVLQPGKSWKCRTAVAVEFEKEERKDGSGLGNFVAEILERISLDNAVSFKA